MAIIESTIVEIEGVECNQVYNAGNEYFYCAHSTKFILIKSDEDSPVEAPTDTLSDIFGAETYEELNAEIERLGLK